MSNADIPVPVNAYTTCGYSPQKVIERMNYCLFANTEMLDIEPSVLMLSRTILDQFDYYRRALLGVKEFLMMEENSFLLLMNQLAENKKTAQKT
ncbi:MAG: hypothetical protein ACOCXT_02940 [Candidatus Dojkabacteria bacterium]